jgi:hypothetical protein
MQELIARLRDDLETGATIVKASSDGDLRFKPKPEKWSRLEVLGHLIDSGVNNLQRFTEVQLGDRPYRVRKYEVDGLVAANGYNDADSNEVLGFWFSLNERILQVIARQSPQSLAFEVELGDGRISDLRFLIEDYVVHMEHHLKQMAATWPGPVQ